MRFGKPFLPGQMRYAWSVLDGVAFFCDHFFGPLPHPHPPPINCAQTAHCVTVCMGECVCNIVDDRMKNTIKTFSLEPPGGNSASCCCCIISLFASFYRFITCLLSGQTVAECCADHQTKSVLIIEIVPLYFLVNPVGITGTHKSAEFVFIQQS